MGTPSQKSFSAARTYCEEYMALALPHCVHSQHTDFLALVGGHGRPRPCCHRQGHSPSTDQESILRSVLCISIFCCFAMLYITSNPSQLDLRAFNDPPLNHHHLDFQRSGMPNCRTVECMQYECVLVWVRDGWRDGPSSQTDARLHHPAHPPRLRLRHLRQRLFRRGHRLPVCFIASSLTFFV